MPSIHRVINVGNGKAVGKEVVDDDEEETTIYRNFFALLRRRRSSTKFASTLSVDFFDIDIECAHTPLFTT